MISLVWNTLKKCTSNKVLQQELKVSHLSWLVSGRELLHSLHPQILGLIKPEYLPRLSIQWVTMRWPTAAEQQFGIDPQTGFSGEVWNSWENDWSGTYTYEIESIQRNEHSETTFGRGGWINGDPSSIQHSGLGRPQIKSLKMISNIP